VTEKRGEPAEGGSTRRIWIDAQLPPALAQWLQSEHSEDAVHVQDLGLLRARDSAIFAAARAADGLVVVLTKDDDFVKLQGQHGPPPHVVWLRSGNVTNRELRRIVLEAWPRVAALVAAGEPLIEVRRRSDDAS
jgi:predicted nuclease of predicted toxin-antitoxin system